MHLGHSTKSSILFATWMLYAMRQGIWIINLFKTIHFLKISFYIIDIFVKTKMPIWFLNKDITKNFLFNFVSSISGEFSCCGFWIRGLLSNYKQISKLYFKIKKQPIYIQKHNYQFRKAIFDKFFLTRNSWPRMIFVSNITNSILAVKEAYSLKLPSIGLVDTNVKSHLVTIPIPSNDESIESVGFFNILIAHFILKNKFFLVLMWFFNIRKASKVMLLDHWILDWIRLKKKKDIKDSSFFNLNFNLLKSSVQSLRLFFGVNFRLQNSLNTKKVFSINSIVWKGFSNFKVASLYKHNFYSNLIKMDKMSCFLWNKLLVFKNSIFSNFFKYKDANVYKGTFLSFFVSLLVSRSHFFFLNFKNPNALKVLKHMDTSTYNFTFSKILRNSFFYSIIRAYGYFSFFYETDISTIKNLSLKKVKHLKVLKLKTSSFMEKPKSLYVGLWSFDTLIPFIIWAKCSHLFFFDINFLRFNSISFWFFWRYLNVGFFLKKQRKQINENVNMGIGPYFLFNKFNFNITCGFNFFKLTDWFYFFFKKKGKETFVFKKCFLYCSIYFFFFLKNLNLQRHNIFLKKRILNLNKN